MQSIVSIVKKTYFNRFDEMEIEYQFHLASRLYAWSNDDRAASKLHELRKIVLPTTHEGRLASLENITHELRDKDYNRDVNNYALRKPYFEKYPQLLLIHNALFKIRHWYCVYGLDERQSLYTLVSKADIENLLVELSQDKDAIMYLSTYAINTFYLYEKLYESPEYLGLDTIMTIAKAYDHESVTDMQLLIYLYTHCVIGESLFYYQPVSHNLSTYQKMIYEIEALVEKFYDHITLDNKFEFLVCAKLCGVNTSLVQRIHDEAASSLNEHGFIVDTHNKVINPIKQSFQMSEHRNVLYIMSHSAPVFQNQPI